MAGAVELLWWKKRQKEFSREKAEECFGPVREEERVFLPFQRVELLGVDKKAGLKPLFPRDEWPRDYPTDWKNLLIWGDNLVAMEALRRGVEINGERISLAGKIRLIYIDPPFATGADFSFKVPVPEEWKEVCGGREMLKEPSLYEELAYRDMWAGRTAEERISSYLSYMWERLLLMKELLADDGSIYVHLDYRMVHFVKLMMDEIFGRENFVNEIVWCYEDIGGKATNYFKRKHDIILMYQKTDNRIFNVLRKGLSESTLKRFGKYFNEKGANYI